MMRKWFILIKIRNIFHTASHGQGKNWHVRIRPSMPIFIVSSSHIEHSWKLTIDFLVNTAMLLFLMFWQQSTLHVHQSQSVHDDEGMPLPTQDFWHL